MTGYLRKVPKVIGNLTSQDVVPVRPAPDPLDPDAHEVLDEQDVLLGLLGEGLEGPGARGLGLPALHSLVDDLDAFQQLRARGEARDGGAGIGVLVRHAHLDLVERVQDVELGDVEDAVGESVMAPLRKGIKGARACLGNDNSPKHAGEKNNCSCYILVVVDALRVLGRNQVQPAAAASASRRDAELVPYLLELVADLAKVLGGERPRPDTGAVRLEHTDDGIHFSVVEV